MGETFSPANIDMERGLGFNGKSIEVKAAASSYSKVIKISDVFDVREFLQTSIKFFAT